MSINYQKKYEEYHNKFWKIYHEMDRLRKENDELKLRLDIYEKRILHGSVIRVSSHSDYGILQNEKYGEIFFHRSQCDFQISNLLVGKKLKFNLVSKKRLEAVNIELIVENSSSPFDILDLYKISDN